MKVARKKKNKPMKKRELESRRSDGTFFDWEPNGGTTRNDIPIVEILDEYDKLSHPTKEQLSAIGDVLLALQRQPENPMERLRMYENGVPAILDVLRSLDNYASRTKELLVSAIEAQGVRSHKRWTDDEDNELIEWAASEQWSPSAIAMAFGRSPSAVSARLSYLVGIGRISQEVAGRFIGTLNGEHVTGVIDGELFKQ